MKFYRLDLLRRQRPEFCFLGSYPEDMGVKTWKLGDGVEVEPGDMPSSRILMSRDEPGIQVPDLVGNTCHMLILSKRLKESLGPLKLPPTQFIQVQIINHKKRVASPDHFIVNPLGVVDILDTKASDIEWDNGDVVAVEKMVLDPKKARRAPDLFRLKKDSKEYLVSERVLDAWRATRGDRPLTNVAVEELEYATSR